MMRQIQASKSSFKSIKRLPQKDKVTVKAKVKTISKLLDYAHLHRRECIQTGSLIGSSKFRKIMSLISSQINVLTALSKIKSSEPKSELQRTSLQSAKKKRRTSRRTPMNHRVCLALRMKSIYPSQRAPHQTTSFNRRCEKRTSRTINESNRPCETKAQPHGNYNSMIGMQLPSPAVKFFSVSQ